MARKPMSAAHKAAISAGLKRYWAGKKAGGSSGSKGGSGKPAASAGRKVPQLTDPKPQSFQVFETGGSIGRNEAALIMFGSKGAKAAKRKATPKQRRVKR